jgi:hypothetical protein
MSRQSDVHDAAELLDAVLDLVDQINGAGFRDAHGHPIEMNVAYLELIAILTARGLVGPEALRVRDGEI